MQATFTDAQTLTLSGLTGSAQSFAVGGKTAVYPIAAFIGSQFVNAAGEWLGNPQAVFYGVNAQVLGSRPPFTPPWILMSSS